MRKIVANEGEIPAIPVGLKIMKMKCHPGGDNFLEVQYFDFNTNIYI